MPKAEVQRVASELGIKEGWKPYLDGFHPAFDESIRGLFNAGHHKFRKCIIKGDGNLPRVRSHHLGIWREEYDTDNRCEYFLTADDDISFSPEAIDILIEDDKPIVGGIYTFKSSHPNYLARPCCRLFDDQHDIPGDRPFTLRWLNGGFIMMKAEFLLTMIEAYKDLEVEMPNEAYGENSTTWSLWCPRVFERKMLSEDWAICQRAREIGFDIWADFRVKLVHWNEEYGYAINLDSPEKFNPIPGWMSEEELEWLEWKSREMESVAEIGSWKGRSTYALLTGCKGPVYAIDHFQGDPNSKQQKIAKYEDVYEIFMKNVGHFQNLKVMKMSSLEAANSIDGNKIDMVFIDGDHSYECVSEDIEAWFPKTKTIICGHDYNKESVRKAVQEKLGDVETFQSIWFKRVR